MKLEPFPKKLDGLFLRYKLTGSQYLGLADARDTDYLCLADYWPDDDLDLEFQYWSENGYSREKIINNVKETTIVRQKSVGEGFRVYKHHCVHYIVTLSVALYNRFSVAMDLSRRWKIHDKQKRITLCDAVIFHMFLDSIIVHEGCLSDLSLHEVISSIGVESTNENAARLRDAILHEYRYNPV